MRSLRFSIQEIQEHDGLSVKESVAPSVFGSADLAAPLAGPVAIELDFSIGSSRVLLSGQFAGRWKLECSRCLADFEAPYRGVLEETYGLDEGDIDAAEEIRQGLFLALPPKPLCRPDCRGLCPSCGKNLNEGPCGCRLGPPSPFEKLKNIKIKKPH